ncbi:MAG: hypothetical protein JXA42_25890 [Anaerolineales bacterium]|nr:hypothetical protein [Anaerolineales bacterium]
MLEADGERTTLKVLEGIVEITSLASGETAQVQTGQSASADSAGLYEIVPFDTAVESLLWPDVSQQAVEQGDELDQDRRQLLKTLGFGLICAGVMVFLVGAEIVVSFMRKKP